MDFPKIVRPSDFIVGFAATGGRLTGAGAEFGGTEFPWAG
jgi:hypothetical protein